MRSLFAIFLFTFFFIFTSLAFASPLQNGQPTATVEGVVTSATNGRMLPHARVYLRSSLAKDNFVTWTDSDDEGHFLFKALEEGTYEVSAEKPGFYVDERKGPVHMPVEVGRGDHIRNMVLRLLPMAVVTGRIANEYEDAVQDVRVVLLARRYEHGRQSLDVVGTATTDDRGEYRIFGVHPGSYYVLAEYDVHTARKSPFPGLPVRAALPEISYAPMFFPSTTDLRQAQRVSVAAGAEVRINFAFLSVVNVSIEGMVVNGMSGERIRNPIVNAYWGDTISGLTRKVEVFEDGSFRLRDAEPGVYTLLASLTQDGENYSDFRVVEVGSAGLHDVQLAVMPSFSVNGHIHFDDKPQQELARLPVEFTLTEKNAGVFRVTAQKRVSRGAPANVFDFPTKLHPGDHYRIAVPSLPQDFYLKSVLVDGHEVPASAVVIYGKDGDLDLMVSSAGGHIEGVVRNSKGDTVGAYLLLTPDVERLAPEMLRSARTGANGKFVIRGVPPDSYKLYAWEQIDMDELLSQPELLKDIQADNQVVRVDENGYYNLEVRAIPAH